MTLLYLFQLLSMSSFPKLYFEIPRFVLEITSFHLAGFIANPNVPKKQLDGNPPYTDILRIDIEINTVVITRLSYRQTNAYRRFTPPPNTARFFPHKRPGSPSLVTKFKQSGLCICADYGSPYYSPRLPADAKSSWRRDRNASTKPRRCSSRAGNQETVQA